MGKKGLSGREKKVQDMMGKKEQAGRKKKGQAGAGKSNTLRHKLIVTRYDNWIFEGQYREAESREPER